jgi:3D (Asp-Asp-Asp) domain-containing protein
VNIINLIKLSSSIESDHIKGNNISRGLATIVGIPLLALLLLGQWNINNNTKDCKIIVDGKVIKTKTKAATVKELLAQEGIKLEPFDAVKPSLGQAINDNGEIKVDRVKVKIVEASEVIPFQVVTRKDKTLPIGKKKTLVSGKSGTKFSTYKVVNVNGVDKKPELVRAFVAELPENQLVAFGNKKEINQVSYRKRNQPAISRGGSVRGSLLMETTAYTHTGNRTATGTWPKKGLVAVDPRVIPLGTRLYIEGYGYAIASDTGGAIKGNIIDVFFDSKQECYKWGRRRVRVQIMN